MAHSHERYLPDIELPCAVEDRAVRDRIGEPLPFGCEFYLDAGRPCILFPDWDYAEDWSGQFVRTIRPATLIGQKKISGTEFWALLRERHEA